MDDVPAIGSIGVASDKNEPAVGHRATKCCSSKIDPMEVNAFAALQDVTDALLGCYKPPQQTATNFS